MPDKTSSKLLVGIETKDDAGVFKISKDQVLIQSVDFFTPVVDNPYDFGQIAVANSLSDIYAMGVKPLTALNIVGFPIATLSKKILFKIIKGGWDKAQEAGVTILGGHSVKDPEIKFGLAVTAIANKNDIIKNSTARIGDKLILTKSLGTGILTTALKNEKLPKNLLKIVTNNMKRLNHTSSKIMKKFGATACTDITGFGLLGHLYEMMTSSKKSSKIFFNSIPLLPRLKYFAQAGQIPGGLKENLNFLRPHLKIDKGFEEFMIQILVDPQTSGGLLFTVPKNNTEKCLAALKRSGETDAAIIGWVEEQKDYTISLSK
jgi:selenide,water dikinase